ncbi:MAG TPA: ParB/RepB/Spo0J family partition protein [Chloroflexota bacterium]|jgi:ParB/RepB/Spo0J family partition protein
MDVLSDALVHVALELLDEPVAERNSRIDLGDLGELVESIRALGVLEPIGVRPTAGGRYVLLFGSRRVAAARLAGLDTIPATVRLEADAASSLIVSLVENVQRRQLSGPERARALRQLVDAGLSGLEITRRTGLGELTVKKWLRVGHSPELLTALDAEQVTLTVACEMAYLPQPVISELLPVLPGLPAPERHRRIRSAVYQHRRGQARHGMFKRTEQAQRAETEGRLRTALELLRQVRTISNASELGLVREVIKLAERWQASLKEATATRPTRWSCGMCGTEISAMPRAAKQVCSRCGSTWWTPVATRVVEAHAG